MNKRGAPETSDMGDYFLYFVSRTISELNDFPTDGDIFDYIGLRLAGFAPYQALIFVNVFDQATKTITTRAVVATESQVQDIESILGRPLIGLSFEVDDSVIPSMLTAECQEIPGLKALTFGWIPDEIGSKLETRPFFGRIFGAGISWKGKLNGNVIFVIPPGAELENRNLITFFVRQVAGYLQRRKAEESARQQSKALSILNRVITAANRSEDLPSLLRKILSETIELLDYDGGGVYITDHAAGTATVVTSTNLPDEFLEKVGTVTIRNPPYDTLLVRGTPVFTDHFDLFSPDHSIQAGFRSLASVPLVSRNRIVGALNVASKRRYVVTDDEREILVSIGRELGTTIERIAAEEDTEKLATNLEVLFNSIDEMVFILDMTGRIIQVNMAVGNRLRYKDEELRHKDLSFLHVPVQKENVRRILQDMATGTVESFQVPMITRDGTRIDVETKITRGWWDNRAVLIAVTRDITERKRSEDALRRANRQLGLLTSVTRHDILNKISVIIGYSSFAREVTTEPQVIQYLKNLESATQDIQKEIEFTRIYQDVGTTDPLWQRLERLVPGGQVPSGITFSADLKGILVFADAMISRVFSNLLDNSVRHGGHVTIIRVSGCESTEGLTITWQDDGVGIPPEEKELIFERGYGNHTGLGLFLARDILSITGMMIRETGRSGEGARFEITVPKGSYRLEAFS